MVEADVDRFLEIVRTPEVARWWGARWEPKDFHETLEESDLACWIVEVDDIPIGFVQVYEETDPEHRHAGIDLFLDPARHGKGLGPEVLRRVAGYLFDERGHHRLVIDPAAANTRAVKTFESVGFRRVGVLRSAWWDHVEERWADGLLLDLLAGELVGQDKHEL